MKLYEYARKINHKIKKYKKEKAGKFLSPVRKIEKFAPVLGDKKYIAMTFDDGPMNLPPNPENENYKEYNSLTKVIIEIMKEYNANGTFNVVGSTEDNYPDKKGDLHGTKWGGVMNDHYPKYNEDKNGGAFNQSKLVKDLIDNGHEISSHGYVHKLFGPNKLIYGSRDHLKNINEVYRDLQRLHELFIERYNYDITLSRPPHYIDKIPDGYDSYDAYALMKYDYLAASFDGGGWLPSTGDYDKDVKKMVDPLKNALEKNPDALNGQIIFQKDGYNMSEMTPVCHALPQHLKILKDKGYEVVTVSKLRKLSPFEDIQTDDDYIKNIVDLDSKGYVIGYKNNTFKPNKLLSQGEMLTMTLTKEIWSSFLMKKIHDKSFKKNYKKNPYYLTYSYYNLLDHYNKWNEEVNSDDMQNLFQKIGIDKDIKSFNKIKRKDYVEILNK